MTPRPHDALFKSGFEAPVNAAALLRTLLPPALCAAVAWETLDGERGSFVDPMLADQHSDLLFSAQLTTGSPTSVYFLLEHQSSSDAWMPLRMLSYQNRIWDGFVKNHPATRLAPIIAVLVSQVPGGWTAARDFEELFDPDVLMLSGLPALVPRFSMIVDDLVQLTDGDLAARPLAAFPKLVLWLLRDARDPTRLLDSFDAWIPTMLELGRTPDGRDRFAVLITYLFQVLDPVDLEKVRAKLVALDQRHEEVAMTTAEYLHEEGRRKGREEGREQGREEGREEGREQGREQGRVEGRLATLRSLLLLKFQTLGKEHEARLQAATPEAIDRYLQRLLTADSLAAVFAD